MVRVLDEDEQKILIEPYGTYDDWYDEENDDLRTWVKKSQIHAIDDEVTDEWGDWSGYLNTEDPLEITVSHRLAERLLS
jgi:hypothetical protein